VVRGHSLRSLLVTAVVASCAFGERMPEPAKPQTALAGSTSATARRSAEQPSPERACTANTPVVTSADDGSREPVFNADVLRLRAQAFQRTLYRREFGDEPPSKEPSPSSVAAQNADERLGKFLPVEHEANLASFHDAIDRLANGCYEDTKVRILAYGASHTQADIYTSYAQRGGLPAFHQNVTALLELFPAFRQLRLMRQWAGIVDITPDTTPIMGRTPVEGLLINCGWGTGGYKAIPAGGDTMAYTVATGKVHPLIATFGLDRFVSGALIDEGAAAGVAH